MRPAVWPPPTALLCMHRGELGRGHDKVCALLLRPPPSPSCSDLAEDEERHADREEASEGMFASVLWRRSE